MYNNIKKFIDPRYATLFLFCIVSLLIIIFMKSRSSVEKFVGDDLKKIKGMTNDISDLETDMKTKLNKSEFNNELKNINGRFENKVNKDDFDNKLDNINGRFENKVNKGDFDKTITDINGRVNSKLNTSDFDTTLANNQKFKDKLNTGDFDQKLADNQTIKTLQTGLGNVPTSTSIGTLVTNEVDKKVGDITKANTDLGNAYSQYNVSMATQYSDYNTNASAKLTTFDTNASTKIGQLTDLNSVAEAAKTAAETAKSETQKMYDNVFKEVSGRVVTQSNVYRDGLKFNPITGFYERFGTMYEAFETREGFSDAVFNKEREVIQDLNAFNTAYYAWITCKSGKCPTNPLKTEAQLRTSLVTAANTLGTSIDALKGLYPTSDLTDGTQATIDKAHEIDALRRDLDTKMNAILMSKNRIDEPAIEYDSTVYAGILWSVLGTSVLYYVFTEL